ncbi:MAG TPA: hypothetical protein VEO74_06340 [Thermoanaerobaculia bacterium]|nr:hypothetical protein [Thermoanaerobaculia bacterium]
MPTMFSVGTAVDGWTVTAPLTSRRRPFATVSFVAALPPSSVRLRQGRVEGQGQDAGRRRRRELDQQMRDLVSGQ